MATESGSMPPRRKNGHPLILFVDDNEVLRGIITEVLEGRCGYTVITADGGRACLNTLVDIRPEMILLDIMMEPMDGWDTLREIYSNVEYRTIPIVLMTGKIFLPREMLAYGPHICGWIKKPIRMEPFTKAIQQIFTELSEDEKVAEEMKGTASPEERHEISLHRRRLRVLRQIYEGINAQCVTPSGDSCEGWNEDIKEMDELIAQEEEWCRAHGLI